MRLRFAESFLGTKKSYKDAPTQPRQVSSQWYEAGHTWEVKGRVVYMKVCWCRCCEGT